MNELSTNEMAKRLRDLMIAETISLRAAVERYGWDYNAVYRRLSIGGWRVRTTLVYAPRRKKAASPSDAATDVPTEVEA